MLTLRNIPIKKSAFNLYSVLSNSMFILWENKIKEVCLLPVFYLLLTISYWVQLQLLTSAVTICSVVCVHSQKYTVKVTALILTKGKN